MKSLFSTLTRDDLWDAIEWLAMPLFVLYPQLCFVTYYRYGQA